MRDKTQVPPNRGARSTRQSPGTVGDVAPIVIERVTTTDDGLLFRELVGRYHYPGHAVPYGAYGAYGACAKWSTIHAAASNPLDNDTCGAVFARQYAILHQTPMFLFPLSSDSERRRYTLPGLDSALPPGCELPVRSQVGSLPTRILTNSSRNARRWMSPSLRVRIRIVIQDSHNQPTAHDVSYEVLRCG